MKKFRFLFTVVILFVLYSVVSAQNISPEFSELKGMEDAQGNTHLLYRIHSYQHGPDYESGTNDIYNMVPNTLTDTIFLYDGYSCSIYMGWGSTVSDYDIWNNDLSKYIFAGELVNCFEPYFVISRFDSNFVYGDMFIDVQRIIISNQDDSLVFALPNMISNNGGFIWDTLQLDHQLVSVAPFDDRIFFSTDFTTSNKSIIFKSSDSGNTFTMVDTGGNDWFPNFYYDIDENHIYREHSTGYPNRSLKVSPNQGNAFTWQNIYSTNNNLYLSLDESQTGAIYLADGKRIIKSTDYGNTFILYKELDKKIIGIYKKPNSDKLYAATKYRIYEITDDTITVIKRLPIPTDIFEFYPLQIGNRWIYKRIDYSIDWNTGTTIKDTSFFDRKISEIQMKPNAKQYYKINDYDFFLKESKISFERIDSLTGLVYRYDETLDTMNNEYLIDNLMADLGDQIISSKLYTYYHPVIMIFNSEDYFTDFGFFDKRNGYDAGGYEYYSLVKGVGLDSIFISVIDAFDAHIDLVGCVLNGIVYGDTTLTDVGDENNPIPTVYKLEQNYPNPFNPVTTIKYTIPTSPFNPSPYQGEGQRERLVTLKVYDILGSEVAILVNQEQNVGSYEVDFNASRLASGIYFYTLRVVDPKSSSGQGFTETKKMVLIK